ncbi:zinc ribbon domain-containing protein [Tissierella creatinini]|nr:zinc ribbon domain-containing protein [Tissierella creatinini]TJX60641.1 zinc ribbon domain-containing protein [Soehngenia saccharolytica]
MYCEKCGYENKDDAIFCENCGERINTKESEEVLELEDAESIEIADTEEIDTEQGIKISENITKSSEATYSWMYEFSLWKNPAVLITVFKVLLIALMAPGLLMFFLTLGEGIVEAFKIFVSILGIGTILMSLLMIAGYVILALAYGGKYYVLFKMDNKGINHIQLDKQHKKAQALGFLTALIGASSNNISAAGAGILGASKKNMYTNFKKVKSVKFSPSTNTIYLNESLNKNQIYAAKEDFQFVKEFILENCPKNIKR